MSKKKVLREWVLMVSLLFFIGVPSITYAVDNTGTVTVTWTNQAISDVEIWCGKNQSDNSNEMELSAFQTLIMNNVAIDSSCHFKPTSSSSIAACNEGAHVTPDIHFKIRALMDRSRNINYSCRSY